MKNPYPVLGSDIMFQIFHKLPMRSMLQCKLVCKEWKAWISDSFFKSKYDPSTIPNHPLHLMTISKSDSKINLRSKVPAVCYELSVSGGGNPMVGHSQPLPLDRADHSGFDIMGSVNGLVALYHLYHGIFYLFNPCTGEAKSMPVHVGFDWRTLVSSSHLYGLCYDPCKDEYKAVLFVFLYGPPDVYVASFKSEDWKLKPQATLPEMFAWGGNVGTVFNGLPHWIVFDSGSLGNSIFFFDQHNEEIERLPLPNSWVGKELRGLGDLNGQLTVALSSQQTSGMEVWTWKVYGDNETWTALFVIMRQLNYVSPLLMMENGEVLMDVNGADLMIYNYKNHTLRLLPKKLERMSCKIITYMPSLVSPSMERGLS